MAEWVVVSAGSEYGRRAAWYEVIESILVLQHEGDHDNLAGNSACLDFEGLTVEQAYEKRDAMNNEPVGHSYDGCHACKFAIWVEESDPPDWLTYEEPEAAVELRELIRVSGAHLSKQVCLLQQETVKEVAALRLCESRRHQ